MPSKTPTGPGRISRLPRWMHRAWAWVGGYFWSSCPICSRKFGGHEWRDIDGKSSAITITRGGTLGEGICPDCTRRSRGNYNVRYRDNDAIRKDLAERFANPAKTREAALQEWLRTRDKPRRAAEPDDGGFDSDGTTGGAS